MHDDGHCHCHDEGGGWEVTLRLIVVTACIYVAGLVASFVNPLGIMDITWVKYVVFLVPYLMVGLPVLIGAAKGIARRELLDEQFLMAVATIAGICDWRGSGSRRRHAVLPGGRVVPRPGGR